MVGTREGGVGAVNLLRDEAFEDTAVLNRGMSYYILDREGE